MVLETPKKPDISAGEFHYVLQFLGDSLLELYLAFCASEAPQKRAQLAEATKVVGEVHTVSSSERPSAKQAI